MSNPFKDYGSGWVGCLSHVKTPKILLKKDWIVGVNAQYGSPPLYSYMWFNKCMVC